MSINEKELIKLVRTNAVSCVVTESFEISVDLPRILSQKSSRVWFSLPDLATVISLYTRLKKNSSLSVDYVKQDDTYNDSSIILSTSKFLKKRLMRYFERGNIIKDKIDFCDIIVLGGVSLWTIDNAMIMNIWRHIIEDKNDIEIPRLVLSLFNLEVDNNVPFDLSQSYFYIDTKSEAKVYYHYVFSQNNEIKILDDMFDVIKSKHDKDDLSMKYLVYCQSYKECIIMFSKVKDLKNVRVLFSTDNTDEKGAIMNNSQKEKDKRIIILSSPSLIPIQNVSVVFDCMMQRLDYKTPSESIKTKNVFISKSLAEQRRNIASEYCYRMCTSAKFDSLKTQEAIEYKRISLTRTFLELIERGFEPQIFLRDTIMYNIIRDEISLLRNTKMIENKRITSLGEFYLNMNLSRYSSMFLQRWITTQQQFFPGIVLSCIIEKADSMFFFLPMRDEEEQIEAYDYRVREYFEIHFKKWSAETILGTYLNMWTSYANEIGTLKPDKNDLKQWCRDNSVNYRSMNELLILIVDCFDKLEYMNRRQIEIGKFSADKVLILSNEIFASIYSKNVCQLVDIDKLKYIDEEHGNFFLDVRRHYNPYVRVPYKIYSFSKISIKRNRKEIRKIIFFHPVDNRFVKKSTIEAPIRKTDLSKAKKEEVDMFPIESVYSLGEYQTFSEDTRTAYGEFPEYRPEIPPPQTPPIPFVYGNESPSYLPPPDSPEYRPQTPDYSPPKEEFEVKKYDPSDMNRVVQFYSKSKDIQDLGEDIPDNWRKVLSNFHIHPFKVNSKSYNSIEHYFHAMKAIYSTKPEMADNFEIGGIVGEKPLDAKRAGDKGSYERENATLDIEEWNKNRDRIMYDALKERMKSDILFKKILMRTKEENLYLLHFERTGETSYWGGSLKENKINGENVLGRMMMMLREENSEEENPFAELEIQNEDVADIEDEEARLFREAFDDLSL